MQPEREARSQHFAHLVSRLDEKRMPRGQSFVAYNLGKRLMETVR